MRAPPMKRTTVEVPDELDARLRHEAQRRGATIADVTREALTEHLGAGKRTPPWSGRHRAQRPRRHLRADRGDRARGVRPVPLIVNSGPLDAYSTPT